MYFNPQGFLKLFKNNIDLFIILNERYAWIVYNAVQMGRGCFCVQVNGRRPCPFGYTICEQSIAPLISMIYKPIMFVVVRLFMFVVVRMCIITARWFVGSE